MGIGVSIFLLALGAILAFAVNFTVAGIEITTIGIILMIVGAIGLLATLFIFGDRTRTTTTAAPRRRERVVEDDVI